MSEQEWLRHTTETIEAIHQLAKTNGQNKSWFHIIKWARQENLVSPEEVHSILTILYKNGKI